MSEEEIINKWFEKNMCVSFKKFTENWEEQQELTNYLQQENSQLKQRIEKAIEYIENEYYSKNTIDINSIAYTTNKFLKVRELLKGDKE